MQPLRELKLKTHCSSCVHKCCSQPYDWVYLTDREVLRLVASSSLQSGEFVTEHRNPNTGHVFMALNLPCRFLNSETGVCNVYESRPLVCRLFPFYPEPLTGHATLLPVQCGVNLEIVANNSEQGWCLKDYENDIRQWLAQLWSEATVKV
jgi:Fe-S-cluster containining protein